VAVAVGVAVAMMMARAVAVVVAVVQDINKGEMFSMLTILVLLSSWCTR
jgi:hypothetical protein